MAIIGGTMNRLTGRPRLPVFSAGGGLAKTYADFQAHIATLAVNGSATGALLSTAGRYRCVMSAANENEMFGTTWGSGGFLLGGLTTAQRPVQHGLPSQAAYNAQNAGLELYFQITSGNTGTVTGLARNGYTSQSDPGNGDGRMIDLIYWDGTQAQRMNPSTTTGPSAYTF